MFFRIIIALFIPNIKLKRLTDGRYGYAYYRCTKSRYDESHGRLPIIMFNQTNVIIRTDIYSALPLTKSRDGTRFAELERSQIFVQIWLHNSTRPRVAFREFLRNTKTLISGILLWFELSLCKRRNSKSTTSLLCKLNDKIMRI